MRRIVVSHLISLDGYTVEPGTGLFDLMTTIDDPEYDGHSLERLNAVGEHAMGATSYRAMAGFWPAMDTPTAAAMNRIPKLVFSDSEVDATWGPVRVIRGDTAVAVAALAAEEDGDILVHGGTSFVQSLRRLDLVDEYWLSVLPAVVGAGVPLFADLGRVQPLRVLSSTLFPSGVQALVLAPDRP